MKKHPICQSKTSAFSTYNVTKGFTLVEVLVSIIILAIGILGTIAMQARALNDNQDAYMRSQAVLLAYDLGDRMRANPGGWLAVPAAADSACDVVGANCTPVEMAQFDYWNWQNEVTSKLSGGAGDVVLTGNMCSGTAANGMRIRITWQRANSDANTRLGNACYSLDIQL
ncbi:MAG: type IV pilus modification protein PilV [Methylovulum sp.]|nr:type IV pilus modification protein PilV [Methylovulum sp.]